MAVETPSGNRRRRGPFSPETPAAAPSTDTVLQHDGEESAAAADTPPRQKVAAAAGDSGVSLTPPGHRLYENGTDRLMAKAFWSERERYKDVMRREQWSECTFHPQVSAKAARMRRPRTLSPQNRFRAEAMRKMEKIQAARKAQVLAELEPCTFQPLTLRAASLSPYAPVRVGGVHEALYRVAEVKRKWAKDMRPEVLAQLTERAQHVDPERVAAPKMAQHEIERVVWRLLHPAAYEEAVAAAAAEDGAQPAARSRSRSPHDPTDLGYVPDPKPFVNPVSEAIFENRKRALGLPSDVVERLTTDFNNGERRGMLAETEALKMVVEGGPHRPTINPASEQIAATARERHLKELFVELWKVAEALKAGSDNNVSRRGRPPLGAPSAPEANAKLTLLDAVHAAPLCLPPDFANDLIEVLTVAHRTVFDASLFCEACANFAKRYGTRGFMQPSRSGSGGAKDKALSRIAQAQAAKHNRVIPRTDKYAVSGRGDREELIHRRARHSARAVDTMDRIRDFALLQELRECKFKPQLSASKYVFVRRSSSVADPNISQESGGVQSDNLRAALQPTAVAASDASASATQPSAAARRSRQHRTPGSLNAPSREAEVEALAREHLSAAVQTSSMTLATDRDASARSRVRASSAVASATRIPARTVMTDDHVFRGSISEEHATGGDDRLRRLGQELMRQQLLNMGATRGLLRPSSAQQ